MNFKSKNLIAIEGNLGCGKTTFMKFLQKYFKDNISYSEDQILTWENSNIVKDFYKDMSRWSFHMEVVAITKKIKNLFRLMSTTPNEIIVSTRCPASDRDCFVKTLYDMGKLTKKEYQTFFELFGILKMPKFKTIIYLKSSVDQSMQRILSKRRDEEAKLTETFIKKMNTSYEGWVQNLIENRVHVVIIDMDKYDSLDYDEEIQKKVLEILIQNIPSIKEHLSYPYKRFFS